MDVLQIVRPLDQDARAIASTRAKEALSRHIGAMPLREHFANYSASKYPAWVMSIITAICIMLLLGAFVPSAIRLYDLGSKTFGKAISDDASMRAVGIATVLLAETGQIAFMLALNVLGANASRQSKLLLYASAMLSTAVALVGNLQVVSPWDVALAFAWIEAIAPPLLTLSTSYVLKEQMLKAIEQRHANEQAYQIAYANWKTETANLERHGEYPRFYANAIIEQLRKANRTKDAKEALLQLQPVDKLMLYRRELDADAWYADALQMDETAKAREDAKLARLERLQAKASGGGGGRATGEVANAVMQKQNEMHVASCPHCSYKTTPKQTELQAKRALAAHMKSHSVIDEAERLLSNAT